MATTAEKLIRKSAELGMLRNMQTNMLIQIEWEKQEIKSLEDKLIVEENEEVIKFLRSIAFPNMAEGFSNQVKLMVEWYLAMRDKEKAQCEKIDSDLVKSGNESLTRGNPGTSKSLHKNKNGLSSAGGNAIAPEEKRITKKRKDSEAKNVYDKHSGVKIRKMKNDDSCETETQILARGAAEDQQSSSEIAAVIAGEKSTSVGYD